MGQCPPYWTEFLYHTKNFIIVATTFFPSVSITSCLLGPPLILGTDTKNCLWHCGWEVIVVSFFFFFHLSVLVKRNLERVGCPSPFILVSDVLLVGNLVSLLHLTIKWTEPGTTAEMALIHHALTLEMYLMKWKRIMKQSKIVFTCGEVFSFFVCACQPLNKTLKCGKARKQGLWAWHSPNRFLWLHQMRTLEF